MPRPKSDDPKRAVTIRVRAAVLARIAAMGGSERSVIEGLVEARFGSVVEAKPARAMSAIHVEAPLYERKAFNPHPKTGKAKR